MGKTLENLQAAFAGESQANRLYLAFAEAAEKEGYTQAARLFRAAAAAETVHAHNHLRAMNGIGTTAENLKKAASGENYEWTDMYPPMVELANAEGETRASLSFRRALATEKEHEELYLEQLDCLGIEAELYDYYVCPVCGHVHRRSAPEKCPICGAPGSSFMLIQ